MLIKTVVVPTRMETQSSLMIVFDIVVMISKEAVFLQYDSPSVTREVLLKTVGKACLADV